MALEQKIIIFFSINTFNDNKYYCNGLAQYVVYCPLWASQSTHFQGFYQGSPHGFVLGSHAWPQNAYNMLATSTTYKALALDARFRCGILQSPYLKTSRPQL